MLADRAFPTVRGVKRPLGCVFMGYEVLVGWVAPQPWRSHTPLSAGTTWWHYTPSQRPVNLSQSFFVFLGRVVASVVFLTPSCEQGHRIFDA